MLRHREENTAEELRETLYRWEAVSEEVKREKNALAWGGYFKGRGRSMGGEERRGNLKWRGEEAS